jgi:ubiquinone/menaquinone biosynthesis C-methylase UbiE
MHELSQDPQSPEEQMRQALLDRFAEQPDNDSLWQTAYNCVENEDATPTDNGIAHDIPSDELIGFADQTRNCVPSERYDLTTNRASNGQRWFEALELFSSPQIDRAIEGTLRDWTREAPFHAALDVGTGTGRMLPILEANATNVTAIDRNSSLLGVAVEKAKPGTTLVKGDLTQLPFDAESFDLITCVGVSGSLDTATKTAFFREISRVLQHGGVYIEGSYYEDEQGYMGPDLGQSTQTAKGTLADMIVDTISGKHALNETLDYEQEQALLAELGMTREYFLRTDEVTGAVTLLSTITK